MQEIGELEKLSNNYNLRYIWITPHACGTGKKLTDEVNVPIYKHHYPEST